jgi:hypothetical protein
MTLYEVVTGMVGESYERAYVWADNERQARLLFAKANPESRIGEVFVLLSDTDHPFATKISDCGWPYHEDKTYL